MEISSWLAKLNVAGVSLTATIEGKIKVTSNALINDELRGELRERKAEILTHLLSPPIVQPGQSFCPNCKRVDPVQMPTLTGLPSAAWMQQLTRELGSCPVCRAFFATLVPMSKRFTARQMREVTAFIESGG